MALSMKDLVAEAKENVAAVAPEDARRAQEQGDVLLDVRELAEADTAGCVPGAVRVPRGLLESRADAESPHAEPLLTDNRETCSVHVLCASGARAALAAHTLVRMGYRATVVEGGVGAWTAAGLPVTS